MLTAIRVCCSLRSWWDSCVRGNFMTATRNYHAKRGLKPRANPVSYAGYVCCKWIHPMYTCGRGLKFSRELNSMHLTWNLWKLLHLHGLSGIRSMLSLLFYNLHCIYTLWFHLSWRSELRNESSETGSLWSCVVIQLCLNLAKEWLEKLRAEFFEGKTQGLKERRDENCVLDAVNQTNVCIIHGITLYDGFLFFFFLFHFL